MKQRIVHCPEDLEHDVKAHEHNQFQVSARKIHMFSPQPQDPLNTEVGKAVEEMAQVKCILICRRKQRSVTRSPCSIPYSSNVRLFVARNHGWW